MTNAIGSKLLGAPVDRVDGPLKVTGAAPYPSDVTLSTGETYSDILARHRLDEISADGEVNLQAAGTGMAPAGAFAARFAEVRIDEELGLLRVARIVSAIDAGRILNEKLARSQIIGAARLTR
jgi:CO/xanthine dehydrogenase Mo-binding subunit